MAFGNPVDLLLLAVATLGLWSGWRRGAVVATLELAALLVSVAAAWWGHAPLAAWLSSVLPQFASWSRPVAFLAVLVPVRWLLGALAQRVVQAMPSAARDHAANHLLGLLPGAGAGALNALLVALLLLAAPVSDRLSVMVRDSRLAERLAEPAQWLQSRMAVVFGDADKALTALLLPPSPDETITLPFTVADPRTRPELEAQMLAMVNRERSAQGLRPLTADPALAEVARAHSRDMFARGYFAHVDPEGRDPFDRLRESGVGFLTAGENLALAPTLSMAHDGLMHSPGHRANILRPTFGRLGIGIVDGGPRGLMVSQEFRN